MITLAISVVVMLLGLLLYCMAANPKYAECGRIMFFCGLLVSLLRISSGPLGSVLTR